LVIGPLLDTSVLTLGVNTEERSGPPWHTCPSQGHGTSIAGRAGGATEGGAAVMR